jgi:hypothetical protein
MGNIFFFLYWNGEYVFFNLDDKHYLAAQVKVFFYQEKFHNAWTQVSSKSKTLDNYFNQQMENFFVTVAALKEDKQEQMARYLLKMTGVVGGTLNIEKMDNEIRFIKNIAAIK